jgi:hypothetical protein
MAWRQRFCAPGSTVMSEALLEAAAAKKILVRTPEGF